MGLRSAARPKLIIGRLSRWGRTKRRIAAIARPVLRPAKIKGRFK